MLSNNAIIEKMISAPEKVMCITHRRDFDGLASAALIMHYFNVPLRNVFFSDHETKDMLSTLEMVENTQIRNGVAVFTDLPLNPALENIVGGIIATLKSNGDMVVWLDHHRLSKNAESMIKKCDLFEMGESRKLCGAELVYKHLVSRKKDRYGMQLTRMAHMSDFYLMKGRNKKTIIMFGHAISYVNYYANPEKGLREIVRILSEADYGNEFVSAKDALYNAEAKDNKEKLRKTITTYKVGRITIGIGSGKHVDDNEACKEMIMDGFGCDVGILINLDSGRLNMRSAKGIDCLKLATSFGGGGHPQAAGATIKGINPNTAHGIDKIRKKILDKAKRIYS